jgi:hypothetical protein
MSTVVTYVIPHCNEDPEVEQLIKHIVLVKVYNTHHHLFKTHFHGNLDKLCKSGRTAKYYLDLFKEILPLLSNMNTMTRFEVKARLPEGTYVDHIPDIKFDFQNEINTIIAAWRGIEWIHLPITHIQRSMERVIDFATSTQVPKRFRCFNVDNGMKLDQDSKNFASVTFMNEGYVSMRSNSVFMDTYNRLPDPTHHVPYPIDWFVHGAWCHHFAAKEPDVNNIELYTNDEYLKLFPEDRLISPIRREGENTMMRLTHSEWYERACEDENFHHDFRLFGGYTLSLTRDSYALFGNSTEPHVIFINETRKGNPLMTEEGGYPNEVNPYDSSSQGTDEDEIQEIIDTKWIRLNTRGRWFASFVTKGVAASGFNKKEVAKRILMFARAPHEKERYVNWRESLKNIPQHDEEVDGNDGVGNFGFPGIDYLSDSDNSETIQSSISTISQSVDQRTSNRATHQEFMQDESNRGQSESNFAEILRTVKMTKTTKGLWRANFWGGGKATEGKTKEDVARNIIQKGTEINAKIGMIDVRYQHYRDYIMKYGSEKKHRFNSSGILESVAEDAEEVDDDNSIATGDE